MSPRHTCFLHLEIFSRWDAETLALCLGLSRLPHSVPASCSECRLHTSGFYTCTGWWHSVCAAVPVLSQFNTHMKVGHLGLPMDMCCRAHASIQEAPDKNGKSAQDFCTFKDEERNEFSLHEFSVRPCSSPRCSLWWLPSPTACVQILGWDPSTFWSCVGCCCMNTDSDSDVCFKTSIGLVI